MGTTAEVRASLPAGDPGAALDAAFEALARVDERMSLWRPSELAALNRTRSARLSAETTEVLAHALDVARASGGAFDPSIEPLLRARGAYAEPPRSLAVEDLVRLRALVGWRRIHLDSATRRVWLEPGSGVDLGGIAKGFAADLALAALRRAGARSGLVDLGGSSLGVFGEPLEVVLRDPEDAARPAWGSFRVSEACVSSSGGDQRAGHILDPRSGAPASGVLGVTVVAGTGIEADALSTAVFVMGAEPGLRLLRERGAAGVVLAREAGRPALRSTPGFTTRHGLRLRPGIRGPQ
jgi:FAD:protein FMN transferase